MEYLVSILVPLGICVALPVLIVWLVTRTKINNDNRRTQILIEAMRCNDVDLSQKLTDVLKKPQRSLHEKVVRRLTIGSIFSLMGLFFLAIAIIMACSPQKFDYERTMRMFFLTSVIIAIGAGFIIAWFFSKKMLDKSADKKN